MIHPKRFLFPTLLAALLCALPLAGLHAQGNGGDHQGPPHGPPPNPLFDALDTNHDGVIDANEIANAPAALKALLKSGATGITREDVRPPRPPQGRSRDAQDAPSRPRFNPDGVRPHGPPPAGVPAVDESPAPSPATADGAQADDQRHGPPRPADDQARAADDRAHDGLRPADRAEDAHRHHAPPSPLFDALDTNHDGIISADEMANAAESLKKLDRSGTGQIKREDLRPVPPPPQDNH